MADGVAINGSKIVESIAKDYITFTETYQDGTRCVKRREDGSCAEREPIYRTSNGSTDAVINGKVVSNSKITINGVSVAIVGDITEETWVASPSPSGSHGGSISNIQPATGGSGQGVIISGADKMSLNGAKIALIGSQVKTCLDTITTIEDGTIKITYE